MVQIRYRGPLGHEQNDISESQLLQEIRATFGRLVDLEREFTTLPNRTPPTLPALRKACDISSQANARKETFDPAWYDSIRQYFLRPSDPRWLWIEQLFSEGRVEDAVHFYAAIAGDMRTLLEQNSRILSLIAEYEIDRQKLGSTNHLFDRVAGHIEKAGDAACLKLEAAAKQAETTADEKFREIADRWSAITKKFDEWFDEKQKVFEQLVQRYADLIPNHEAAKYWGQRYDACRKGRLVWGFASIAYFLLASAVVVWLAWLAVSHVVAHPDELHLWLIGWTIVGLGLLYWPLRILVRSYLSSYHLMLDAEHRRLLIQTYLAMIKHGENIPDNLRAHFLEAIFRPASDGIVKDDAAPMSTLEQLARTARGTE